jgi:hypothetical protein
MKKMIFLTLLGFSLFSCVETQLIVAPSQNQEKKAPTSFKQEYFPEIKTKDSVLFYNADSIKIEKTFGKKSFFVEDGVVKAVDSLSIVSKTVPKWTPSLWIAGQISPTGEIRTMLVSFSKYDIGYNLTYQKGESGCFILNNKAQIIFNGRRYDALVSTKDPTLLFYMERYEVRQKIETKADGRR